MPSLIDSHVHLQDEVFEADLPAVIERAVHAGVRQFVCNGTREQDWPAVAALAERWCEVIPCFGLHPWYVNERSAGWLAELERRLNSVPSAVGEIGLDRWIEDRDEAVQEEVFLAQMGLAKRLSRPVMLHCVRSYDWLMHLLKSCPPPPAGFLLHAFAGPREVVAPLAERGAYFSFAGNILDPRKTRARQSLLIVPRQRLLIESDAPDMPPPPPYRVHCEKAAGGRDRNEPANAAGVLRGVAELLDVRAEELAETVSQNSMRFLAGLIKSPR